MIYTLQMAGLCSVSQLQMAADSQGAEPLVGMSTIVQRAAFALAELTSVTPVYCSD